MEIKKVGIPENLEDNLKKLYDRFVFIVQCRNGDMRKFILNPGNDKYFEELFRIADKIDEEGVLKDDKEED